MVLIAVACTQNCSPHSFDGVPATSMKKSVKTGSFADWTGLARQMLSQRMNFARATLMKFGAIASIAALVVASACIGYGLGVHSVSSGSPLPLNTQFVQAASET
jgi:hypothetical protein